MENLYDSIQNPLEDKEILKKIIYSYSKMHTQEDLLEIYLYQNAEKKYTHGESKTKDSDLFYSRLFNEWKNNIVNTTREEFIKLREKGIYGNDFIILRNFLTKIEDVSTKKEINAILEKEYDDEELNQALRKYSYNRIGKNTKWNYIYSGYISTKKDTYPDLEHKLIINCESEVLYAILNILYEECKTNKIPLFIKYNKKCNTDNSIVIYTDNKNLKDYLDILDKIYKSSEQIKSNIKQPPILSGIINNWIGYESETINNPENELESFATLRAKPLKSSIKEITYSWIKEHLNYNIKYKEKTMPLSDYICIRAVEDYVVRLKNVYKINNEYQENDEILKDCGYKLSDVKSGVFKQNIFSVVRKAIINNIMNICNDQYDMIKPISMKVRDGKEILFNSSDLEDAIISIAPEVMEQGNLYDVLVQKIQKESKKYGIDQDNYCFNRNQNGDLTLNNQETIIEEVEEISEEMDDLIERLNPEILKQNITFPNGKTMSTIKYIKDFVYPIIPENGKVILNDNTEIDAVKFIEKYLLKECQTTYNGNLPEYIIDRTKNNKGTTIVKTTDGEREVSVKTYINFIKPEILQKKVLSPSGEEITGKEYLLEYYCDFIPENGKVVLRNGIEIQTKQFIEQVLFGVGQEKYRGNLANILYNTTKNNKGIIEFPSQEMTKVA